MTAWPVRGEPRVLFRHEHYPTIVEEDRVLPTGRTISWLRYADSRRTKASTSRRGGSR